MSQTYSAASIYGNIDRMGDGDIQAWLDWHKRLKYPPRFINIFTAAKFDQGPDILRRVRASLPDTMPVWRGFDGKDAWGNIPPADSPWDDSNFYIWLWNHNATSPQMAAGMWFNRRVRPFVDVIRETGAIIHLLNEASVLFNVAFETEQIRLLGEEGIRAGAFAWAPGVPDWSDYNNELVEDEVKMAAKYSALVMVHEYSGIKPEEQNSLINRNQQLVKVYDRLALPKPDVFLGEFGLAKATILGSQIKLDPNKGWREMGVSDAQYFGFVQGTTTAWYLPNKVSFSLFDWMGWGDKSSFGVGTTVEFLDLLAKASEQMSFSVEDAVITEQTPSIVTPRPMEATIGIRMRVKSIPTEYRNMRDTWNYQGNITGDLRVGDVVRRFDIPVRSGQVSAFSTGTWVYVERLSDETPTANVEASGYIWSQRVTWESIKSTTQEVPATPTAEEEPTPEPPLPDDGTGPAQPAPVTEPVIVKKSYAWVIEATEEQHAHIEQSWMAIMAAMAYLGQAMAGAKITLQTDPVA